MDWGKLTSSLCWVFYFMKIVNAENTNEVFSISSFNSTFPPSLLSLVIQDTDLYRLHQRCSYPLVSHWLGSKRVPIGDQKTEDEGGWALLPKTQHLLSSLLPQLQLFLDFSPPEIYAQYMLSFTDSSYVCWNLWNWPLIKFS